MARISAAEFKPQLSFRFQLSFNTLPGATFYVKSMDLPVATNNSIEIDYGNTSFFVKGKTRWNKLQCTTYAYEGTTIPQLTAFLEMHQQIISGTDQYNDTFNLLATIQLKNPLDIPVTTFSLYNAFFEEVNYGQVDWSGNEVIQPTFTIVYDYCTIT